MLLLQYETNEDYARGGAEIGVIIGAFMYLAAAGREAWFLGRKMFFENLVYNIENIFYSNKLFKTTNLTVYRPLLLLEFFSLFLAYW